METVSLEMIVGLVKNFGLGGLLIVIWWLDNKNIRKVLETYQSDMAEARRMYENNVELVKDFRDIATDLKDVVIVNAQAFQRLDDSIKQNQFCPAVRLEKRAQGAQG